jgi:hypothetical protein
MLIFNGIAAPLLRKLGCCDCWQSRIARGHRLLADNLLPHRSDVMITLIDSSMTSDQKSLSRLADHILGKLPATQFRAVLELSPQGSP